MPLSGSKCGVPGMYTSDSTKSKLCAESRSFAKASLPLVQVVTAEEAKSPSAWEANSSCERFRATASATQTRNGLASPLKTARSGLQGELVPA